MPSILDQLWEDAAGPLFEELHGIAATYSRLGLGSVPVTAIDDSLDYPVVDTGVVSTSIVQKDWSLKASALVIAGQTIEPRKGDRLSVGDKEYQVVPTSDGPPAYLLPGGLRWSVHTEEVSG